MRACIAAIAATLLVASTALADDARVTVGHASLIPAEVTIAVGDTVTFFSEDQMPGGHTLVADDGSFESPPLAKGEEWFRTFHEPGSYAYHIQEHPSARGTIHVE